MSKYNIFTVNGGGNSLIYLADSIYRCPPFVDPGTGTRPAWVIWGQGRDAIDREHHDILDKVAHELQMQIILLRCPRNTGVVNGWNELLSFALANGFLGHYLNIDDDVTIHDRVIWDLLLGGLDVKHWSCAMREFGFGQNLPEGGGYLTVPDHGGGCAIYSREVIDLWDELPQDERIIQWGHESEWQQAWKTRLGKHCRINLDAGVILHRSQTGTRRAHATDADWNRIMERDKEFIRTREHAMDPHWRMNGPRLWAIEGFVEVCEWPQAAEAEPAESVLVGV